MPNMQQPAGMIRKTERATRIAAAITGAALTIAAGWFALNRIGEPLVSLSYDMPFIIHRPASADDVRIVYINQLDGETLDRRPQAMLLDRLGAAGAKGVVYDIIFDRPSADPATDREFAAAIRRFRGIDANGRPIAGKPQRHVFLACGRKSIDLTGVAGEQLVPPNDTLLDAADDFGLVAVDDDSFITRKLSTGTPDEPSLVWKAAIAAGARLDQATRLEPRWLDFAGPPPVRDRHLTDAVIPSCSADSVLRGANPAVFRDKLVMIGGEPGIVGEALGKDLFGTPFHRFDLGRKLPLMSGVEVQANGLANLLHGNWLTRSSREADLTLVLTVGSLIGAGLTLLRPLRAIITAFALVFSFAAAGVFATHYENLWFPWTVASFLQVPVALVWGIAAHSYIERFFRIQLTAEQRAIRAAFAKYLSPQMLDRLTAEGFRIRLGGEKIEAAMMFTDIEDFTAMSERIGDPQLVVATLNDYFERVAGGIVDDEGIIIKFLGDSIYAAGGAPLADPQAALKAVRAAWNIHAGEHTVVDGRQLKTRIGVNYGEVVAGNVGSARRLDYSLIGDATNLASRLEGLNRLLDTQVLLSEAVQVRLDGEFRTRRVGKFRVKGRHETTTVHELLGPVGVQPEPEWVATYHQALAALDAGDLATARRIFAAVNQHRGPHGDGPSRFFLERLDAGEPFVNGIVEIKEK